MNVYNRRTCAGVLLSMFYHEDDNIWNRDKLVVLFISSYCEKMEVIIISMVVTFVVTLSSSLYVIFRRRQLISELKRRGQLVNNMFVMAITTPTTITDINQQQNQQFGYGFEPPPTYAQAHQIPATHQENTYPYPSAQGPIQHSTMPMPFQPTPSQGMPFQPMPSQGMPFPPLPPQSAPYQLNLEPTSSNGAQPNPYEKK